ncbi:Putative GNAT domain, acyl-CoA N-acyltransferase [Septoria linicola]|uniref:GNAT domain, acyl-CoA N-acyltransferase n=1 Tax=Septoria linicola TaxID=215465 RepID=A0A9Q9AV06_9PEZI|nr:putative GNAT domain, acyl-CoA N-acyltransferase [Septoria linicola]USW53035.1 Putative GNAT domain, acyl-CoA N-acyltransferase [Septoria linicola]
MQLNPADDTVIPATLEDTDSIVKLSATVQDALTTSGSLQIIGPLKPEIVRAEISDKRCYIIKDTSVLTACAFYRQMTAEFISKEYEGRVLDIAMHPEPWLYLHSVVLRPDMQGRGLGNVLMAVVAHQISQSLRRGTLFLDCWAGNDKLRAFYTRAGFRFVEDVPKKDYVVTLFCRRLEER